MNKKMRPAVTPLLLFCVDGHRLTSVLTGLWCAHGLEALMVWQHLSRFIAEAVSS